MENINNIIFIIIILILFYIIYNIFFIKSSEQQQCNNIDNFTNMDNINIYNFSSTTCGYCKQFQPTWDEFTKSIKDYKNINTLDIKCDKKENQELCNKYNIPGYPTVIIEKNNTIIEYNGPRTVDGLYNSLNLQLNNKNKIIIYNFNTNWCSYSKKFESIWNDFVLSLSNDELTKINPINVKCDVDSNKELCNKYDIPGYPFVMIIENEHNIPYLGPRTVEGLRKALNLNNNKTKIYNFNTSWCSYSVQFQPIWNTFYNSIKINDNVEAVDVKCDEPKNKDFCKQYNIEGYPSVIIQNGNNILKYNGPRTVDGLKKAVNL